MKRTLQDLIETAQAEGITVDEYADYLMGVAEAFPEHLKVWNAFVDGLKQEVEDLRAGFEAAMKAKQQEVEHWRGKAREAEGVVSARIEIINDMAKEETATADRDTLETVGHEITEHVYSHSAAKLFDRDEVIKIVRRFTTGRTYDEDAAIIEQAEREEGFHGQ